MGLRCLDFWANLTLNKENKQVIYKSSKEAKTVNEMRQGACLPKITHSAPVVSLVTDVKPFLGSRSYSRV